MFFLPRLVISAVIIILLFVLGADQIGWALSFLVFFVLLPLAWIWFDL